MLEAAGWTWVPTNRRSAELLPPVSRSIGLVPRIERRGIGTLLLHFAATIGGRLPTRFSFRSVTPLFDFDSVTLNSDEGDRSLSLWTAGNTGIGMKAETNWE